MKFNAFLFVAIVIMSVCISSACAIQHDDIMKYDFGDSGPVTGTWSMNPQGHAVFFKNPGTITVTGLQVFGCKFGTGEKKIYIEIWDKNLTQLYKDSLFLNDIPVEPLDLKAGKNCDKVGTWADIPLPDHVISGDFYVVVFTYSPLANETTQGMFVGFTTTSITATSHTVTSNPNFIVDKTIYKKYSPAAIDWMIRVYYTKSIPARTDTPIINLTPQNVQTIATIPSSVNESLAVQTSEVPSTKAESTKASPGLGPIIISLVVGVILWKKT